MGVIEWKKAVILWFSGRAEILESYQDQVRSISISMKCPAVVRLTRNYRAKETGVRFNRSNVYRRDKYTCQYCGKRFNVDNLTFDHVYPRAQGGTTVWNNIVTCCKNCNRSKRDRTPSQAGMVLLKSPAEPGYYPRVNITGVADAWISWLGRHCGK